MVTNNNMERNNDKPQHKETVISQLFGEFVGFLKEKGFTKGKEYETKVSQIFECSRQFIWVDDVHPLNKINIILNSIDMTIEFAVLNKKRGGEIIHHEKLPDLRYNVSSGTDIALIPAHQAKFDDLFKSFKRYFDSYLTEK